MSALLVSCEKDADIHVPQQDPKLVVYSYISPQDSVVQVSVTASNSVFGNSDSHNLFSMVDNATVTITTNGSTYNLPWNPAYSHYIIGTNVLPVNPGQTYELSVNAAGFETVSASTRVPQWRDWQFHVTYNGMHPYDAQMGFNAEYRFNVDWKHYDDNDYYRLAQHFYHIDSTYIPGMLDTLNEERNNNFYTSNQVSGGIIADVVTTNTSINQDPYPYRYGFYYDLVISTYDYYKFHETVNNYNSGNPFAEPTLVYTNMKNGYGIFAGYIKVTKRIDY